MKAEINFCCRTSGLLLV